MVIPTRSQLFFLKAALPFYKVYLMNLSDRLLRIARAATGKGLEEVGKIIHDGTSFIDKELDELEKKLNIDADINGSAVKENVKPIVSQLENDLALFHLGKGASWDEVKKAYRGEAKKYHTDRHNDDEEKKSLSHEIMLIYNSAYERLKKNYGQK